MYFKQTMFILMTIIKNPFEDWSSLFFQFYIMMFDRFIVPTESFNETRALRVQRRAIKSCTTLLVNKMN